MCSPRGGGAQGGGRLQYGRCKGIRRETISLAYDEAIIRIAGRIDAGRRQRQSGVQSSACSGCLLSLQVTTSRSREAIFGLSRKARTEGVFSFQADYKSEIIGVKTVHPDLPIPCAIQMQPRLPSPREPVPLPLISASRVAKSDQVRPRHDSAKVASFALAVHGHVRGRVSARMHPR